MGRPVPFGSGKNVRWVEEVWERFPDALVGIRTGQANGVVVIDVDRHGVTDGFKTFKQYDLKSDTTAVVSTPGGGQHWYFATPEKLKSGTPFGPGIDFQAEGRMIIGPENYRDGKPYLYINGHRLTDLAPFPPQLMPHLRRTPAQQRLDKAVTDIEGTLTGSQHNKFRDWCWSLAPDVVAGRLDEAEFRQRMLDIAALCSPPMDRLDAENCIESALRKVRAEKGGKTKSETSPSFTLPDFEPAEEPADITKLLDGIVEAIASYVSLDSYQVTAIALFILHCFCLEATDYTPRLIITSPTKRCGKSTLLRVIGKLVPRPLFLSGVTAAVLFRSIGDHRPVLLVDEADNAGLKQNEDLRIVFNEGVYAEAKIGRTVGDAHEPKLFPIFAPVVFAGIGELPSTTMDRGIIVRMRRKLKSEDKVRFDRRRIDHLSLLCRQAARFAMDNVEALTAADPVVPDALNDRELDGWRPLLSIADMAGPAWAEAARAAALALSEGCADRDEEPALMLLVDCRKIFEDLKAKGKANYEANAAMGAVAEITSAELMKRLHALEDRPWLEWGRMRKPITQNAIARLLRGYDIRPGNVGPRDNRAKGYLWAAFDDAWKRYGGGS